MQCEEWADANSELFKEVHDEAVHKNSYKRKLYELISASLGNTSQQEGAARQSPQNLSVFLRASPSSFLRKEPALRFYPFVSPVLLSREPAE